MSDKTTKNIFDDGYTTHHDDGSTSKTYKNIFDDGYTTYHDDGSTSKTYKNILDDGYTTYHEDGSKSKTYKNILNDGYTTYHDNGSTSNTTEDVFSDGFTTYHEKEHDASIESSSFIQNSNSWRQSNSYEYLRFPKIDFSIIVVAIIGALIVSWLFWLYTGKGVPKAAYVFDGALAICLIETYLKKGKPYFWSWLYYISSTALVMFMVNNKSFETSSLLLGALIWLTPFGIALIIGFMGNMLEFEDSETTMSFVSYFLMGVSWFCCIYKSHPYRFIYEYCILGEKIAIIVLALISLLLSIHNAKSQEKTKNFWERE